MFIKKGDGKILSVIKESEQDLDEELEKKPADKKIKKTKKTKKDSKTN